MATTDRLDLPMLVQAQAQKEMTHNEALALLDLSVFPAVENAGTNGAPSAPDVGQCWIVGNAPTGAWAGQAHKIAGWTEGGWRFASVPQGGHVWNRQKEVFEVRSSTGWISGTLSAALLRIGGVQVVGERQPAIADLSSGGGGDQEARHVVNSMLAAMRAHGLIATA